MRIGVSSKANMKNANVVRGDSTTLNERYSIPPILLEYLFC